MAVGRERAWDLELDGNKLLCLKDNSGAPVYRSDAVPKLANDSIELAEQESRYLSWHSGFGWATRLLPNTYFWASGCDLSKPRQLIMGPLQTTFAASGNIVKFAEIGSALYVLATRYCQKVDTTNDDCETPNDAANGKDFGAGAVGTDIAPFDGQLVVLFSSATDGWTFDGSTTWDQMGTNNIQGRYMASFFSEKSNNFVLARTYTSGSNPVVSWLPTGATIDSTSWVTPYNVGDTSRAITGMAATKTMAVIAKWDGLYIIDGRSGLSQRVMDAYPISSGAGTNLFVDSGGQIWFPSPGGCYLYNPLNGQVDDVTPGRGLNNESPIYGQVTAIAQYKGWYYAWVYNGTDSYLMLGRRREDGEPGIGPMIWHGALTKVTGAQVTATHVTAITSPPRLYYGYGSTVGYIRLPSKSDNPVSDSGYRYAASGSVYLSADDMGQAGSRFSLAGIVFKGKGFTSSTYADVYAQIDGNTAILVGRLQASGRQFVPVPTGTDWRFSTLALRLDITNPTNTTTPQIYSITILATERAATRALIQTSVICSARALSKYGIAARKDGRSVMNALEALSVQGPVTLKEWWDGKENSERVLVAPIKSRVIRYKDLDNSIDEMARVVDLALVSLSSETVEVEAPTTKYYWDSGQTWNSTVAWG